MEALAKVKGVTKTFNNHRALDDVNFEIKMGNVIGLLGPNGSGKTTLLNCMAGLQHINNGEIIINETTVINPKVKNHISYMPSIDIFSKKWTVKNAIEYFQLLFNNFNSEKCKKLLEKMKINESIEFKNMSLGTIAKVKLIFTLSKDVSLFLLDEPFANIDLKAREEIYGLILEEFNPNSSIVLSTHFINEVEMLFDNVIFMNKGQISEYVNIEEYREKNDKSISDLYREVTE